VYKRVTFGGLGAVALLVHCVPAAAGSDGSIAEVSKQAGERSATSVETYDVAAVKLGMSPTEARVALKAKGFVLRPSDPQQDSWKALVSQEVAKRRGTDPIRDEVTRFTMATGPQGEHVEVWYSPTPTGAVASSVKFTISSDKMTSESFIDAAVRKYGHPTVAMTKQLLYCARNELHCKTYEVKQLSYLEVRADPSTLTLSLSVGSQESAQRKGAMAKEIDTIAPKNAKAMF